MISRFLFPLALAGVALPALATGADMLPGLYRVTTIIAGETAPTIRYECFGPGAPEMFTPPEPVNAASQCTFSRNSLAGGRIDVARSCTDGDGAQSTGSLTGTHSETGFTVHARLSGGGLPGPLEIRSVGQRVAAVCRAG